MLGGCAIFDAPINKVPEVTPADFSKAQESDIKAGVLRLMNQPQDAVFTDVTGGSDKDGVYYVCGKVKSRASYGAMKPFLVKLTGSTVEPVALGGAEYQDQVAVALCHQYGIN